MLDTKLVLIEGLTGAGKSTTAQRLWLHLERSGYAARWFYEHDATHPIWGPGEQEQIATTDTVVPRFVAGTLPVRWRRLADECAASGACTILESTLFQSTVGFLLAMNVDECAIAASVLAADRWLADATPVLVYFRCGDVAEALRAVFEDRRADGYAEALIAHLAATPYGKQHGLRDFAGLVRFYARWAELVEALYARVGMLKITIDAAGWQARERQLVDFLGLPEIREPAVRIEHPSRYIGRFRDVDSDDQLLIAGNEHGLYLDDARRTQLIPRPDGTFHVAAMCVELSFGQEGAGLFHSMNLRGNLPGLHPVWTRVEG